MKRFEKFIGLISSSDNAVEFTLSIESALRDLQIFSGKKGKLINLEDIAGNGFGAVDTVEFFDEEVD